MFGALPVRFGSCIVPKNRVVDGSRGSQGVSPRLGLNSYGVGNDFATMLHCLPSVLRTWKLMA